MKALHIITTSIFFLGTTFIFAQQNVSEQSTEKKTATLRIDKSDIKVQRHTVMSQFDSGIASSEEERLQKKQERIAEIERRLSILDTLDISERRRRTLLHDLKYNPFSNRLSKATLVDTKFEDASEDQQ